MLAVGPSCTFGNYYLRENSKVDISKMSTLYLGPNGFFESVQNGKTLQGCRYTPKNMIWETHYMADKRLAKWFRHYLAILQEVKQNETKARESEG